MVKIIPIQTQHVKAAKQIISAVAQRIFEPEKTADEFEEILAEVHELEDVDNFPEVYAAPGGVFLVVLDGQKVIGTGGFRRLETGIAELKRLWLLEAFHGRGIGFRVVMKLFKIARKQGYERMRLQTTSLQVRAVAFYKRIGFIEIPNWRENDFDDVSMEITL